MTEIVKMRGEGLETRVVGARMGSGGIAFSEGSPCLQQDKL